MSTPPSPINHILWQGLPGSYLTAANGGLLKSINYGSDWGSMRPNTEFATTWPAGAVARKVSYVIGPRQCDSFICWHWDGSANFPWGVVGIELDNSAWTAGISDVTDLGLGDVGPVSSYASVGGGFTGSFRLYAFNTYAGGATPNDPTLVETSGFGFTITKLASILYDSDTRRLVVFSVAGSPSDVFAGTIDWAGQTQTVAILVDIHINDSGDDTLDSLDGVTQAESNAGQDTDAFVTMGVLSGNAVVSFIAIEGLTGLLIPCDNFALGNQYDDIGSTTFLGYQAYPAELI